MAAAPVTPQPTRGKHNRGQANGGLWSNTSGRYTRLAADHTTSTNCGECVMVAPWCAPQRHNKVSFLFGQLMD